MLTARNFVAITIGIAVVSLAWACYELARPPDSGGSGRDSYGTRALGQRGLFEILADLGIPVQRILAPPTVVVGREVTLVLWEPQPDLVQMEPAYLHAVAKWVEGGGRVVVAPAQGVPLPIARAVRTGKAGPRFDGPRRARLGEGECHDDRPGSREKRSEGRFDRAAFQSPGPRKRDEPGRAGRR